jgi:uncharacterized protein YecA (UPF0149 family)
MMKNISIPRHMILGQFASEMRKRQIEWTAKGQPITEAEMIKDLEDDWKKTKAIYMAAGITFEELVQVGKEALTDDSPPLVQPPGFDKAVKVVEAIDRKIHVVDKIGRNAPCPCGSGKKYKKCCLVKDQAEGGN